MEIKVISKETIKPSSPTPSHLKTFKRSIIDIFAPPIYIQFSSFYIPNQNYTKQSALQHLKQSLSQSLTIFYPLAGRINDTIVECNDNGVLFVTTRVDLELSDLLSPSPKFLDFHEFSPPVPPFCPEYSDQPAQIGIQVNEFNCGGIAISFCFSHFIMDMVTFATFLKCWSRIATRSLDLATIIPAVSMYPQGSEDPMPEGLHPGLVFSSSKEGRGTTKRFVFDGSAIMGLKERVKSERVLDPSRVEAVCCFLWKHMMVVSERVWGSNQPSILIQSADLRRRMPDSPGLAVGNIHWESIAYHQNTTKDNGVEVDEKELLGSVRKAIEKIKHGFVPKLLKNGGYETIRDSLLELKETCSNRSLNPYTITSWCKTGLNEVEFGWGKPIWVGLVGAGTDVEYKNVVVLMDGETSEKIEAWITLDQREMRILENDQEFLAFASLNPTVSL